MADFRPAHWKSIRNSIPMGCFLAQIFARFRFSGAKSAQMQVSLTINSAPNRRSIKKTASKDFQTSVLIQARKKIQKSGRCCRVNQAEQP